MKTRFPKSHVIILGTFALMSACSIFSRTKMSEVPPLPPMKGSHIAESQIIEKDSIWLGSSYTQTEPDKIYWGCNDTIVKWVLGTPYYTRFTYKDGLAITTVPVSDMSSADNLNTIFFLSVAKDRWTQDSSFNYIFDFYKKNKDRKKDWTALLLKKKLKERSKIKK